VPLEAKRSRHVAVAVAEVNISGGIAVGSGEQGAQPQQPDLVQHEAGIGRHRCQPLHRKIRSPDVLIGSPAQQCLDQNGGGQHSPDGPTRVEEIVEDYSR
jgi:hypothetical protein